LIDPKGPGSFTHLSGMLHADGKVITPLFKGRLGQRRTDKATGEIKQVRYLLARPESALGKSRPSGVVILAFQT
jgi:hypothetical protein